MNHIPLPPTPRGLFRRAARLVAVCLLALAAAAPAHGGDRRWEPYFDDLAAMDDASGTDWAEAYDMLCELEDNPVNINAATREELERLPFLSDAQVSDILEYICRHGPMASPAELQLITSLDYTRRHLLQCFTVAGPGPEGARPTAAETLRRGRHELVATLRAPLYDRAGDRNGYLGYKYKHWLRYTFTSGDILRAGFAASQDGGEPFFAAGNTLGYDFYSFYISLNLPGRLESVILGRYTASFGMGLVTNTGFSLGKLSALSTLGRTPAGLRPTASRSTASYLQGAAARVRLGRGMRLSLFASWRPHDATLNKDDGSAATIVTSGYHRAPAEMAKKNNTHSATAGANLSLAAGAFRIGATAAYTHYDRPLRPNTAAPYRRHYPSGSDFANAGVDYSYTSHSFSLRGETAIDRSGNVATVNSATASLGSRFGMAVIHRFYSCRYEAVLADAFSEGGRVQNEHGAYLGLWWQAARRLRLTAYADYARFAWPRYRISRPSAALDGMLTAAYTAPAWRIDARYRLRRRQRDNADKTALTDITDHRLRLALTAGTDESRWQLRTQADASAARSAETSRGLMLSQSATLRLRRLQLYAMAAWFATDDYDSRLYATERGPLYSFQSAAFYGRGLRLALMARADLGRSLMLLLKAGTTKYFDRSAIGSGHRLIDSSAMTDIDAQLRWRF